MNLITDIFRATRPQVKPKSLGRQKVFAQTWVKAHPIEIDLRRNVNPAKTILHELIHQVRPSWNEKEVQQRESTLWRRLNQKQIKKLLQVITQ